MTLGEWLQRARANEVNNGVGKWRSRALSAMRAAVVSLLGGPTPAEWPPSRDEVLAAVDEAYPFGPRSSFPYKAWLAERKLLVESLMKAEPTQDEFEVCEVAADLVEEGKVTQAVELLAEQAPNRHGRKCPVCGQPRGTPCREPDLAHAGGFPWNHGFTDRIVPHVARVKPREGT